MNSARTLLPNSLQEQAYRLRWERLKRQIAPDWIDQVRFVDPDGVGITPHVKQSRFIDSPAKRKIIRAGRRGGKTTGMAIYAVSEFKRGLRVLYTAPTQDQVDAFWEWVKLFLAQPLKNNALYKNETRHIIEVEGTKNRIRAKTAWDADSLRGDYADLLIFDEYQLTNEEAWGRVGAPMLADNDGDAVFIYTPPSLHSRSRSKARDPRHAATLFKKAQQDKTGRCEPFHFSSHDIPPISVIAREDLTDDMTALAYEQEILALDKDEAPGALWTRDLIERQRVREMPTDFIRIAVGVDPPGGVKTECGIIVSGLRRSDRKVYVIADYSLAGTPGEWASAVIKAYDIHKANYVVAETNFGGKMVESTLRAVPGGNRVTIKEVHASRGKAIRAEPCAAKYEKNQAHHVGKFLHLEDEMVNWEPNQGMLSPNRLDALVWSMTAVGGRGKGAGNARRA